MGDAVTGLLAGHERGPGQRVASFTYKTRSRLRTRSIRSSATSRRRCTNSCRPQSTVRKVFAGPWGHSESG